MSWTHGPTQQPQTIYTTLVLPNNRGNQKMKESEMKKIIEGVIKSMSENKADEKQPKAQPQTKPHSIKDIKPILEKMTIAQLKKQFGTNVFEYKFIGIKDFMTRFNIQSETKYDPRLNYENKHLILEKIANSYTKPKKEQAIKLSLKTLKERMKNPPKQLYGKPPTQTQIDKINENYQKEINRWG